MAEAKETGKTVTLSQQDQTQLVQALDMLMKSYHRNMKSLRDQQRLHMAEYVQKEIHLLENLKGRVG